MSRKRHKPEEIVSKLRQVDVLVSQGQTVVDAIRTIGVTEVCGTSCWTGRSSTPFGRRRSSSKAGGGTCMRSRLSRVRLDPFRAPLAWHNRLSGLVR